MNALYSVKTKKGHQLIRVFLWSDFMENKDFRKVAEVEIVNPIGEKTIGPVIPCHYKCSKTIRRPLFLDEIGKLYITWNNQRVYLENFLYPTVDEINEALKNGDYVYEDLFLAAFLKDTEHIGVVMEQTMVDTIIPTIGIAMGSNKTYEMLCVPVEKPMRQKINWHYKIHFEPYDESLRPYTMTRDCYFCDLASHLRDGYLKLVNLETYLANQEKEANEPINKLKSIFSKKKKHTIRVFNV